jgi:hypothetical protein
MGYIAAGMAFVAVLVFLDSLLLGWENRLVGKSKTGPASDHRE